MELRPGYKKTEIGVIPEDWAVVRLQDCFTISAGGDIDRSRSSAVQDSRFRFPVYANAITNDGLYGFADYAESPANSVTITARGYLGHAEFRDHPFTAIVRLLVLVPTGSALPSYVSSYINERVTFAIESTGVPQLTAPQVGRYSVALPPLPEQRAIAEALSDIDASIAALSRLIAKKRDLRQGAMQRLLTGQTRLPGFTAPWQEKRLGELVDTDPENLGADTSPNLLFNYIALEDVDRGRLRGWTGQQFISAPSRARRRLRNRDVLFATVRPNLQAHLLFHESSDKDIWVCSTGFCVLRCKSGVADPAFIFAQLFGPSIPVQIEKLIAGSNYPAVNSGDVRGLWIGAPELDEQAAIARVLSDMDAEIAALDARLQKTRALKQAMMQALLTGRVRLPLRRDAASQTKEAEHA